ncbi:amino acid adenylation domain-containing protein [Vibrio ouci]|uniref:Amino acid adenylation domain-containing protein n=1 Tax=Vibrio ouci TaxID=2499078 RepID=A0A4Y8WJG9_9VIBR|nr:amino acid adenylation domain-containing protein [Vibrio ouci]TFH92401.1 amino acid adenylation domain-containing protein [Vibrio ouci]
MKKNNLLSLFSESVSRFPDKHAIAIDGNRLTYSELDLRSDFVATAIEKSDGSSKRVALFLPKAIGIYPAIIGTLKCNKSYVPLSLGYPVDRIKKILADGDIDTLIVDNTTLELLDDAILSSQLVINIESDVPTTALRRKTQLNNDSEAYVLYTSGTTGDPKGIPITHGNVVNYVSRINTVFAFNEEDRFSHLFDLTFDLSVHDMFVCWSNGACLYPATKADLLLPDLYVKRNAITVWFSVPSLAVQMRKHKRLLPEHLASIRYSLFCGEAMPKSIADSWLSATKNADIVNNLYGPTEATIAFTYYQYTEKDRNATWSILPIGTPFAGLEVAIVDSEMNNGDVGELLLGGDQLTQGYLNNPYKNQLSFVQDVFPALDCTAWYRSGDLVERTPDSGTLLYKGRLDNQIKIQGFRVEVADVEENIRKAMGITDVAVIKQSTNGGDCLAAVITEEIDEQKLIKACQKHLPDYMLPKAVFCIPKLPLNQNGKTDYSTITNIIGEQT